MANTKDTYPTPDLSGRKTPYKSGKGRNMRESTGRCYGEICVLRPFPRVPPSPLSNYNQIKDRVIVARHHWRVKRYYARHNIKTQKNSQFADFVYTKKRYFFRGSISLCEKLTIDPKCVNLLHISGCIDVKQRNPSASPTPAII